tara:strand:+ start:216 stop:1655 length:1440 start_codon:yes stop_codon:yes gene_type:complete
MGRELEGVWRGIATSVADTLYESGGFLMVRTGAPQSAGDVTLTVEGTHRWPTSGRVIIDGGSHWYTGTTTTTLTGLAHDDPDNGTTTVLTMPDGTTRTRDLSAGLKADTRQRTPVMLYSRDSSALDNLRQSFFVQTAQGADLDLYARNFGLARPRGLSDAVFRELLKVMVYLDATTIYSIEKVLTVLKGTGNFVVYENLDTDPHKVFVNLGASLTADHRGKAYVVGGEAQARDSTVTNVTTTHPPTVVYGVYASTDAARIGTNYLHTAQTVLVGTSPQLLTGAWLPRDAGSPLFVDGSPQHWTVLSFIDATTIQVGRPVQAMATLDTGHPNRVLAATDYFRAWMVGHKVQITQTDNPTNYQIADIVSVDTPYAVTLNNGTPWVTEVGVGWRLVPVLSGTMVVRVPRHTVAGSTVTCPGTIAATVLVDYTTVPSAQAMADQNTSGTDRFPFYLFDDTYIVQTVVDLITAAGVQAVVEVTL